MPTALAGVQLDEVGVLLTEDGQNRMRIEFGSIVTADQMLAYAQLVMLQALVERQSLMAGALTKLAEVLAARTRPVDPAAAADQVAAQMRGVFDKLGITLPNAPR